MRKPPRRQRKIQLAIAEQIEPRVLLSFTPYVSRGWTATPNYEYLDNRTGVTGTAVPLGASSPAGAPLIPATMRDAYGLGTYTYTNGVYSYNYGVSFNGIKGDGTGQTIAIVDVGSDPDIATDLQTFDSYYNLPNPPSFQQLSQTGSSTNLPGVASGWPGEISLDVEWSHVMAPGANIILFAASDLYAAVQEAASYPGVAVVSMSFGISGNAPDSIFVTPSGHTGVSFYAGSGDTGSEVGSPSQSVNVVSVGGTSLSLNGSGGYGGESAWAAGGGGVSSSESQPAYQEGIVSVDSTTQRVTPDVSMDADPGTGVAIVDSYDAGSSAPWELIIGGTSLATPLFAGVVAVADQGRVDEGLTALDGSTQVLPRLYELSQANYTLNYHDITSGNNGHPATAGYDMATGIGSAVANNLIPDLAGGDNISGRAFIDTNDDGVYTAGTDTALANKVVYLDLNNNGLQDPTDPTTTTNATGQYSFTDVIGSFTGVVRLAGTTGYLPETTSTITTAYNTSQTYNLIIASATVYTATATPNPVTNNVTTLAVSTSGGSAASGLTYTWSATSEPAGATPTFSVNGTASAINTTVTFNHVGYYSFTVKITDAAGHTAFSTVTVNVTGLAAYYKMNEGSGTTTADASGNGNTATLSNTTWTTAGVAGDGLTFDGTSSEATVPPLNINSNTVTMSGWIDSTGTQTAYAGLVFNREGSNGNGINIYSGNTLGYTWGTVAGTSGWNSGLTFTTGVWTFVAVVITPNYATLYMQPLGGTMVSAINNVANVAQPFDQVTQIGQDAYSASRTFDGSMDEVRIYNTALNASAIAALGKSSSFLTAVNDAVSATAGSPGTVNVLTNDGGPNGDTLSITSFSQGSKGTVTNAGNGNLTYTTTATLAGTDTFTYTITDGVGDSSTATVNVTIDGLDVYYEMNEGTGTTTADATGNGYTGQLNGTTWTTGVSGKGLAFNGSGSEVTVPVLNLNTNTVTFSGWINSATTSQAGYTGLIFDRDGANGNGLDIYNGNDLGYTWGQSSSSNFNSGLAIPTNTWTFVAVVITASNAVLYMQPLNGTMTSATNTLANAVEPFSTNIEIGQDAYSTARTFNGSMDEVRIYDTALTPAAIASLATTTSFITAANYVVTAAAGSPGTVNVLANDSSADAGKPLSITSFTQGSKGTVTAGSAGNLIYTTTATIAGTDSFTYTVTDASGHTATASVSVSILGLDAYYKMNEGTGTTTADATGNGYTGTLSNTAWTTGINNTAGLAFNGFSSNVALPALNLNTNSATFTAWIKSNSSSQSQYAGLVFNRDGSNGNGLNFFSSGNLLGYTWGNVADTSGWNSGLVVPTGVWTFVAVVITPTNATLYMEPTGSAMQTATNTVANVTEPFSGITQIGQDAYSAARTFNGSMDEVQIYDESLAPAAIAAIVGAAPTVATAATATPSPVTGTTAALSTLGASSAGESTLTYTWTATSIPTDATAPTYSINGSNAAKNTTATFTKAGSYTFQVTIQNTAGQAVTSSVTVTVNQTFTSIAVTPATFSVFDAQTTQLAASALDQFGNALATQPTFTWSTNVGTVSSAGLFTSPASGPGTATVQASSGAITGSATVNVILSVINGTAGNDTIRLIRSGSNLLVYVDNPTTPLYTVPYATLGSLTVAAMAGNDSINIDFSGGSSPVPSGGISVDGGTGTDALVVTGTTGNDTAAVTATTINVNLTSVITYTNIESITVNGNGGADTLNQNAQPGNGATLAFNGTTTGGPSTSDTLNVNAGTFTFLSQSPGSGINPLSLASLTTASGTSVVVGSPAESTDRWVLSLNALTLASNSRLNLGDNDLILHNANAASAATTLAAVASELQTGRSTAGTWNGPGIDSSQINPGPLYALGYALNTGLFTTFDTQPVTSTDILVKYTYLGDANLDGAVDGSDYTKIDYGYLTHATGWSNGDFNYDGIIDASDYTLMDNAFNTQTTALPSAMVSAQAVDAAVKPTKKVSVTLPENANLTVPTVSNASFSSTLIQSVVDTLSISSDVLDNLQMH